MEALVKTFDRLLEAAFLDEAASVKVFFLKVHHELTWAVHEARFVIIFLDDTGFLFNLSQVLHEVASGSPRFEDTFGFDADFACIFIIEEHERMGRVAKAPYVGNHPPFEVSLREVKVSNVSLFAEGRDG
jgi:hypothetical protein